MQASSQTQYYVLAIPLNRPESIRFLESSDDDLVGHSVQIIGQRPTRPAEDAWIERLRNRARPTTLADLLAIDDPHGHLIQTRTDHLVPQELLEDSRYLRLKLGGWTPIYFAVFGVNPHADPWQDPLLGQAERLAGYGDLIRYFGADPDQVQMRLKLETGVDQPAELAQHLVRLHGIRAKSDTPLPLEFIDKLYEEIRSHNNFGDTDFQPIPRLLLFDALLGAMIELETIRRHAVRNGEEKTAMAIGDWQEAKANADGLRLILKGQYIVGRSRRSSVLIAPQLGVVIKQPGPEPFHEVALGARVYDETEENWPYLTADGALVTPRGRLRLIVEEDLLPRIARVFGHQITFSTLTGLTIDAFVPGETIQQQVLNQPDKMTPELYAEFVLHQQVCELLGVENGDWHSANFMVHPQDGRLVHVDWGAARPLRPEELNDEGRLARFHQMKNIAFSFHDHSLADRVMVLHEELAGDNNRLAQIRKCAQALVDRAS